MPTTAAREQGHQSRWEEIVNDPSLRNLPYKVETNHRGQIVLSPHRNRHSALQEEIQNLLRTHAPEGRQPPEFAIATDRGVKVPDVIWSSPDRWDEMAETGDPTALAPEICIEVTSSANTEEEIQEKRSLYLEAGADEAWIVDQEGDVRFFDAGGEMDASAIVPTFPGQL